MNFALVLLACCGVPAAAELRAGVAVESINPVESGIATQLGGYGAREGKPAHGTLDTIFGKALVLEQEGRKAAVITVDTCSVPLCLLVETLEKAKVGGLSADNTLICASHSHTGLEGFALDRRNVAGNPNIGIFSEEMLNFTTDRLAKALRAADAALQPVRAGSGAVSLPGMNRNRRGADCVDDQMTVLRLDKASDGKPLAVLVNFTAHGTFVDETDMLVSGEWSGSMQRTVEDLLGGGAVCLYANGAEGDIAPAGREGGSHYEQAYNYGRKIGIAAWRLAAEIPAAENAKLAARVKWVALPQRRGAPDFIKIAGDEYNVTQEQLDLLLQVMFPEQAPLYALRVGNFQMTTFPGEPICAIGTAVKEAARAAGAEHPCVASNTSEHIGYILSAGEYHKSGYEVTASFYGDGLGALLQDEATALCRDVAGTK